MNRFNTEYNILKKCEDFPNIQNTSDEARKFIEKGTLPGIKALKRIEIIF